MNICLVFIFLIIQMFSKIWKKYKNVYVFEKIMKIKKLMTYMITTVISTAVLSTMVFAQKTTPESNAIAIDTMWTLLAAFLVFFMQAGFAMVEAGFTRAKNA